MRFRLARCWPARCWISGQPWSATLWAWARDVKPDGSRPMIVTTTMRLTLHAYLFVCLGIIAVVPILMMGVVRMQRAEASQIDRSDRATTLAAQAMAREAAQIMQAHTNAVRALARQVEVTG